MCFISCYFYHYCVCIFKLLLEVFVLNFIDFKWFFLQLYWNFFWNPQCVIHIFIKYHVSYSHDKEWICTFTGGILYLPYLFLTGAFYVHAHTVIHVSFVWYKREAFLFHCVLLNCACFKNAWQERCITKITDNADIDFYWTVNIRIILSVEIFFLRIRQ